MGALHFEQMAQDYADSRPPYPHELYAHLQGAGVIGPGVRVLEVGAGAGLATRDLVALGCEVTALEPGPRLAAILGERVPAVQVLVSTLEAADLPEGAFDTAVAATALHWVDPATGMPILHRAVRPGGPLAVWRHRFGVDGAPGDFRQRVQQVVDARPPERVTGEDRPRGAGAWRPADHLVTGHFTLVEERRWEWSVDLTADQVGRLFATFSDWTPEEVAQVRRAAVDLGGVVTERYATELHLLRRRL